MSGISFDIVGNNSDIIRKAEETRRAFIELSGSAENQGKKIDSAFKSVSIGDTLKKQIYEGSQAINGLTESIIKQKSLIKDVEQDVRTLGEAYRKAGAGTPRGNALFADFKAAKSALQEEKSSLFELQTQQAQARLSVRKLKDEYSLYQKEGQNVVDSNNNMALSFKKTLAVIGGTAAIKKFVSDVLRVRGEFQQLDVAFTTLLQSKEKANALMAQMVQTAAKTPFNLTELATGARQLVAYGFASEGVNDTLIRLGNIASGLGLPLERLTYLYGTTMTQGRLYTRDLMQFTTSGIPMLQGLADMYGVSTAKVNEMVTAGKIGFPEVQKVIENLTNEGGKFFNLMEEQSKTITGKISNLGDAMDGMFNSIGQANEGVINDSIDGLKYLVENYEQVGRILLGLVATYGTYRAAAMAVTALHSLKAAGIGVLTTKEAIHYGWLVATEKAHKLLNAAMLTNPYVLLATVVAGAAAAMWALHDSTTAAEKAQLKFNNEQEKFNQQQEERKQKIESLIRIIQDEIETEYAKIKAYEELQKYSPALVTAYSREELATLELAKSQTILNEERDRVSYENIINQIEKYTEYINRLGKNGDKLKNVGDMYSGMVGEYGTNTSWNDRLELAKEDLKKWNDVINEYNRLKKEAEEKNKPVEVKLLEAKNNRDQILQEFLSAEMTLKEEQRKIQESGFGVIPIDVQIRFDNAKVQLANINTTIASLIQGKSTQTYKEAYETAKKEWKVAQKTLEESKKKSKADYDKAKKDLDDKEKSYKDLGGVTGSALTKQEKQSDKLREQQQKLNLLMNKQALDQSRSEQDLQNQVAQSRIDAMQDGSTKTIAQMQLNHKKEMQQFEREKEDKLRKAIEDARTIFDAEEDAKKSKNPKYTKKTFDASGVKLSGSDTQKYGEQKMYLNLKQSNETQSLLDKDRQAWNEYLAEYGSFQEKKQAITAQYNEKIANASTEGEKASLKKELEGKQKDLNLEEIKSSINFADIFGNLDAQSTEAISIMRDKLKEVINKSAKDLKPTDLKALQDAFTDIDLKISERNPFGELKQGIDDYKESTKSVIKAQEDLNTVQQGGEVIVGLYTDATGKVCKKLLTQEQAERNLSDAQRDRRESQIKLTESVNSIGEKGQQLVTAGSDITDMLTSLGVSIPESISGALDGIGQVMDSMASIDITKPMSIITGITGTLAGIGKTIGSLFGGNGDKAAKDSARLEEVNNRIAESEKIINGLIEKRIELIKEATIAEQKNLSVTTQQAIDNQKKYYEQQLDGLSGNWLLAKSGKNNNLTLEDLGIGSIKELEEFLNSDRLLELQRNGYGIRDAEQWKAIIDGYNSIIGKEEELQDMMAKNLTGMTLDDAKNALDDFVRDADTSFSDVADNFEDHMRDAMFNIVKQNYLNKAMEDWYKDFEKSMSDGALDKEEAGSLKNRYENAYTEAQNKYLAMLEAAGISAESDPTREASKKGIATASQDSVDENNGRLTVIQGHTYSINEGVRMIQSYTEKMAGSMANLTSLADVDKNMKSMLEMRSIAIGHLSNIEKNTARLEAIESTMVSMNRGIQDINTKGLTLKR